MTQFISLIKGDCLKIIDTHCHCYEINTSRLESYLENTLIVCVSDNISSSEVTIDLSRRYSIIPCIGIHPWEVSANSLHEIDKLVKLLVDNNIVCLGEIGLDKKFRGETYRLQYLLLTKLLEYAKEYDLVLNLHSAGAWREVYELVFRKSIDRAYFHWYTGPRHLINELASSGYFIGINPAWIIQEKHRELIDIIPLENMLTESDSPYIYRGLEMNPNLIIETIKYVASRKNTTVNNVAEQIRSNFYKLFKIKIQQ